MPGMMMSPMGNGGFGKPVTVKMSAHDALLFQNQQARQAYEQQHAYMQWFSKQQQQQTPQAAPTTEEDEWGDEEEQDAGLALLAQREEAEQQQKLQAIHNEKQQFIRDNVTVFMDKYPDADTAFAELEAAAEQHAAMPTPEKSKKLTNDLVERTAKAATAVWHKGV